MYIAPQNSGVSIGMRRIGVVKCHIHNVHIGKVFKSFVKKIHL